MDNELTQRILANPKFAELVRKKSSFAWTLSLIMLVIYYGFIVIIAFDPALLGTPLSANGVMTVGIPVGLFVILSAIVLTGIYVRRANREFDGLTQEVIAEAGK